MSERSTRSRNSSRPASSPQVQRDGFLLRAWHGPEEVMAVQFRPAPRCATGRARRAGSILITSAPMSPRQPSANGPEISVPISITRMPSSGPVHTHGVESPVAVVLPSEVDSPVVPLPFGREVPPALLPSEENPCLRQASP